MLLSSALRTLRGSDVTVVSFTDSECCAFLFAGGRRRSVLNSHEGNVLRKC